MGLDWDRIRADYAKKATPEELGTVPGKKKGPDPFANGGRHTGSLPHFDRAEIVRLYTEESMHVPAIAKQVGCHPHTVYNNLIAAGVQLRDDRRATKPDCEVHTEGHPDVRGCVACKRRYWREKKRRERTLSAQGVDSPASSR